MTADDDNIERWEGIAGVDVTGIVATASPQQLRSLAAQAAIAAAEHQELSEPPVVQAIELLRRERADSTIRAELAALADRIDEEAFDKRDEVDEGYANYADYQTLFGRARAASALAFALEENVRENAPEALYEAYHALDCDDATLNTIILRVLDS